MTHTRRPANGLLGPILCYGMAAVVAMWVVAFITHHPAVLLGARPSAILMVGTLLTVCIFIAGAVEPRRAWKIGLGAGLLASVVNLLIFGSYLTSTTAQPDAPSAALEVLGFIILGAVTGLVGSLLGVVLERIFSAKRRELIVPAAEPDWLARFGIVAASAAFPLLLLGALVTSSEAALSVPDWPQTYGANMFLYPIGLMTRPGIFLEHSHRLFGAMVGFTTILLVLFTFFAGERRRWMLVFVSCLLLLVVGQGILGGIRVSDQSSGLALAHGVIAQIFFALLVAYAACLSPMFKNRSLVRGVVSSRRPKIMVTAFLHTTILQLIFGALYRHFGTPHAMYSHIGLSLVVFLAAIFSGFELRTMLDGQPGGEWRRPRRAMTLLGTAILACVTLQFTLGWITLFIVGIHKGKPDLLVGEATTIAPAKPLAEVLVPTLHQANGALLLAMATLGYVWVRRFWRSPGAGAAVPSTPATPPPSLSTAAQ